MLSAGFQDLLVKEQTAKTKQDVLTAVQQTKVMEQQVLESTQKVLNMKQELLNLVAQECLLKAQFDLTKDQGLNTQEQTILVRQKVASERAQTIGAGVDADSVIGRQKELYKAQADGFKRDAEQKAAKILIDTWNVRRTTDTGTQANTTNRLDDANVGRVVNMLMTGVGA
ncbi:virion structural protein [Pseudomonas phage vB_Pae_HMKU_23]|nr:virion structural protein [Pseudomonas phage vB_Pae_HMKU_23]